MPFANWGPLSEFKKKPLVSIASGSIGLEKEDGWQRHSITNEGGNYAVRFNKGNKKLFLAYSPDDKVLGIITTMGNY